MSTSGYEQRVIDYLADHWPFHTSDQLAAATRGLDVFKQKYPDFWDAYTKHLTPEVTGDVMITIILDNRGLYRSASSLAIDVAARYRQSNSGTVLVDSLRLEEGFKVMHKIATTDELQYELRRLLAYAQNQRPSRQVLASQLRDLSLRVASFTSDNKTLLQQLDKQLEKAYREADEANAMLSNLVQKLRRTEAKESFERWLEQKTVTVRDATSDLRDVRESLTRIQLQESSNRG